MKTRYRKKFIFFWVACQVVAVTLLFPIRVYADDCNSDPLNAADCMRSPGFRPVLGVAISLGATLATILVTTLGGAATGTSQVVKGAAAGAPTAVAPTAGIQATVVAPTAVAPAAPATPATIKPGGASPPAAGIQETVENDLIAVKKSDYWEKGTSVLGDSSSIIGAFNEFVITKYINFEDSAETIQKIRDSVQAWRNNPSAEAAEDYIKSLRGTTNLRVQKLMGTLDVVGKAVDVTDAVMSGLKTSQERGYTGTDKVLTIGAEVGKKGLNWMLTKNPVVGAIDFVSGKVSGPITGWVAGKLGYDWRANISIQKAIDNGSAAWDETTQNYASYTGGSLSPDGSGGVVAADAKLSTQDNYLSLVRRIKSQVASGELDTVEAGARIRKLRDTMDPGFSGSGEK